MIRSLTFASCYVYSPWGSDAASERSRLLRATLKANDAHFLLKYADRVRQQVAERAPLAGFIGSGALLVPIPGSVPSGPRRVSVADRLARALVDEGLGREIWPGLHRIGAVTKSATAVPGTRPSVAKHYQSFAIEENGVRFEAAGASSCQVVLIDDVVTKGRTLLAAAARVHEAMPSAEIRAFALIRTMGLTRNVKQLLDPCVGEICWRGGDAYRTP